MKVDVRASYASFVFPFTFASGLFSDHAAAAGEAAWAGRDRPLPVWKPVSFPIDDLLPHVTRYLNPPADTLPTADLWELQPEARQSLHGGLGAAAEWVLDCPGGEIRFHLDAVHLVLFRFGVGFLTVRIRLESDRSENWLDFLHYFRFLRGQRRTHVKARRRTGIDRDTRQPIWAPFFPDCAGGVPAGGGPADFGSIVDALLCPRPLRQARKRWWSEVFAPGQMLPFAVLYADEVTEAEVPLLLYRVRGFAHSRQPLHPTPDDLRMEQEGVLPYAEGMWFLFEMNGTAFLAVNAPQEPFSRETLPDRLGQRYFLLFLLVLHQRFVVLQLSEHVARHWLPAEESLREAERDAAFHHIRDTMLAFTARAYFSQVTLQQRQHACYRRWQEIFLVETLYREVNARVQDMHGYLELQNSKRVQVLLEQEQQQSKRLERRLSIVSLLVGLPVLLLTLVQANAAAEGKTFRLLVLGGYGLGSVLAGVLVGWLFILLFGWQKKARRTMPARARGKEAGAGTNRKT